MLSSERQFPDQPQVSGPLWIALVSYSGDLRVSAPVRASRICHSILCSTFWRSSCHPVLADSLGEGKAPGDLRTQWHWRCAPGPVWPPRPGLPLLLTSLLCFQHMCLLAEAERSFLLVPQKGSYWDSYLNTGQRSQKGDNQVFILAGGQHGLSCDPAAMGSVPEPPHGSCTGCLGDERTLDTNVLGRSCYKFHFKKKWGSPAFLEQSGCLFIVAGGPARDSI